MCIIIYNRRGTLDSTMLHRASEANPDGAGLMYAYRQKLHVFKNIENEKVIARYYEIRKSHPDMVIVLHFRIATDGEVNTKTCHPYMVNDFTGLMHNGILSSYTGRKSDKSDTQLFISENMADIPNDVLWTDAFLSMCRLAIGYGNKFVLLRNDGLSAILNEGLGDWDKKKNNWFSNSSYKKKEERWTGMYNLTSWTPSRVLDDSPIDWTKRCSMCGGMLHSRNENRMGYCDHCIKDYSIEE